MPKLAGLDIVMVMNLIRGLIKGAVVAKVIQIAQRELSKPENQRKIKDGLSKVAKAGRR